LPAAQAHQRGINFPGFCRFAVLLGGASVAHRDEPSPDPNLHETAEFRTLVCEAPHRTAYALPTLTANEDQ
jgi:hypothetical protein